MTDRRAHLPQLDADIFLADGGLETTLIFDDGLELPDFAAYLLLGDEEGRAAMTRYFDRYAAIARRDGVGLVLETPTWRANPDWGARQGHGAAELARANRDGVELLVELRSRWQTAQTQIVISGCIGPRGDGYRPGELMSPQEAQAYHHEQIEVFAGTDADLVTCMTISYPAEAIGLTEAARSAGMPIVVSFTVETDGRLPTGETLGEAIEAVDAATDGYPVYYMVNCAHPTHFADVLDRTTPWAQRIRGLRANASRLSHAELDEAEELDGGDPTELAADYVSLRSTLPQLTVLGGCCGTNHEHIDAISTAVRTSR